MADTDGMLTQEQANSPHGCGAGTPNACFALTIGPGGIQCSLVTAPAVAQIAGLQLGWRVNVDPDDKLAWCPLGVLKNCKTE